MSPRAEGRSVDLAGLEVRGVSVGGIETCIEVPEYKLAFDLGRCSSSVVAIPTVLFTHAHMDHMGAIATHAATRSLIGMRAPRYVVPPHAAGPLDRLFEAWRELDGSELPHELISVAPGEELALGRGRFARPFRSIHRAPCQGYGIWSKRQKLQARYRNSLPEVIAELRRDGVTVTDEIEYPELVFVGDTRIDVLEREEVVRKAKRLILEATFIDDRVSIEDCRASGHVHLDEIAERADLFENEAILLTHFSARYRPQDVRAALKRLPEVLRGRVQPFL